MAITTKTGDSGKTSLFGGVRVEKDHIRIECNGLIDEVNARIGLLLVELEEDHPWCEKLLSIQRSIMLMMSHIATPEDCPKENKKPHPEEALVLCDSWVVELNEVLKDEKLAFLLPGGNRIAAACHFIRTGVRTAERGLNTLNKQEAVPEYILKFFNRLSDLFYLLAMVELVNSKVKPEKFMLFPSQKLK